MTFHNYLRRATALAGLSACALWSPAASAQTASSNTAPINVELPPYSLVSDGGVLDQSAGFQAALDAAGAVGGEVFAPGVYKAAITLPKRVTLIGTAHRQNHALGGTVRGSRIIAPNAGVPVITLPDTGAYSELMSGGIKNLVLQGGQDSIFIPRGAINFDIDDVFCISPARAGIHARGFLQEVSVRRWEVSGGQYGFYMPDDAAPPGSIWRFDKCDFNDVYLHGQKINNVYVNAPKGATSNVVLWRLLRLVNATQDGMWLGGGLQYWHLDSVNGEGSGYLGAPPEHTPAPPTTGSVAAGATALTVASIAGLGIGGPICVQGAGVGGRDLRTTIANIAGTAITLAAAAQTTVTDLEVTSRQYSDIKLAAANGSSPRNSTFTNFAGGLENGSNAYLYAIDTSDALDCTIVGATSGRPIYDPAGRNLIVGGNATVRTASAYPGVLVEGSNLAGRPRVWRGNGAPTAGTWRVGDRVMRTVPVDGGPIGDVCVVAGTPGTWKPFGVIH